MSSFSVVKLDKNADVLCIGTLGHAALHRRKVDCNQRKRRKATSLAKINPCGLGLVRRRVLIQHQPMALGFFYWNDL